MKTFLIRAASVLLLSTFALSANAATLVGTFLVNGQYSLIHDSATPAGASTGPNDFLRWLPDQEIVFDLTGTDLTAGGSQEFMLMSNAFDFATFTLVSLNLDLSGPNGFAGGSMEYSLVVDSGPLLGTYSGLFEFDEILFGGSPFNTSDINAGVLNVFAWGGDANSDIGIDFGISAAVPIPAPLLLFASGLFGLGLTRRRK